MWPGGYGSLIKRAVMLACRIGEDLEAVPRSIPMSQERLVGARISCALAEADLDGDLTGTRPGLISGLVRGVLESDRLSRGSLS